MEEKINALEHLIFTYKRGLEDMCEFILMDLEDNGFDGIEQFKKILQLRLLCLRQRRVQDLSALFK